ncbi:hypothetical protein U1Q18_036635 [Sarracenia purpurea var. burkii]
MGGSALVSLLRNPECCLKVLVVSKCRLGLLGVLQILQALSENCSLEELNLAENADMDDNHALQYDSSPKLVPTNQSFPESSFNISLLEEGEGAQQGPFAVKSNQLEVSDSKDDRARKEPAVWGPSDSCTSSYHQNSSDQQIALIQDLSTAIVMAKHLKLLDLSMNGFSTEMAEKLYCAWSSGSRAGLAQRHIQDKTIHFSVQGCKCCGVNPCCRRD